MAQANQATSTSSFSLIGPMLGNRGWPMQILIGVGCALVVGGLRYTMIPLLGDQAPLMPFVLAVFAACILSGFLAGMIATLVSCYLGIGVIAAWPPPPGHSFASAAHIALFLLVCGIICGVMHRLQNVSRREHELLTAANTSKKLLEIERYRLSLALKAGGSGTFDWDIKNNINMWSEELLQLYGLSTMQFEQTFESWLKCIYSEDVLLARQVTEDAMKNGHAKTDFRIVRQDTGAIRWVHSRCVILYDERRNPERALGVNVDITELKQAEAALRASEQRLKLIYNNASDCIYLVQIEHDRFRFVSVNDTFLQVSGYAREQVEGKLMEEIVPAANHELVRDKYREVIRTRQRLVYEEVTHLPPGKRYGEITLVPIAGVDDSIQMILGAIKDVTAMQEAETALREAASRKDEFLAMLAHELRNPLAPIHNIAHLFVNTPLDAALVTQYSAILLRQTRHMMRLVDDLLDVSRITRGTIALKCEYTVLDSIIDGALETLKPILETKQQSISVAHSAQPILLFGDPARLSQIFVNLLGNAAKYSPAQTKIHITLQQSANFALVRVVDQGIGIDPATLPHIFELFVQADQSLDRTHGGLGVGLTIVKRLVEMHGGQVEAHSDGVGRGSEFIVRLPLTVESENAMEPQPA